MEAAFFDLDKTVIAKASMVAFGREFYREGLISRRALAKGIWTQFVYVRFGAGPKRLARMRRSALAITRGWSQAQVIQIVTDSLDTVLTPIVYPGAAALIAEHRRAGQRVYLISAGPAEIVGPVAAHLGVDDAIASQAVVDAQGCYSGELGRYCYGPAKAEAMGEIARRDGLDLSACWAYSDSATDLPMLEAVGHPVVVNPDRRLRRVAEERGWEVLGFERSGPPPSPSSPLHSTFAPPDRSWVVPTLTLAALSSGGAAWWALRRGARG